MQELQEIITPEAIASPEAVGLAHYEALRQKLLAQLRDWEGLVSKSGALAQMEGDEAFPDMCRDINSPEFVQKVRGDAGRELQTLRDACQLLVRHIGKASDELRSASIHVAMAEVSGLSRTIFEPYEQALMRIVRKYKPGAIRRMLGLYEREMRIAAMTADLQQLFTRIIYEIVQMHHLDYQYAWHPLAMGDAVNEIWYTCMETKSDAPVVEAASRIFFEYYWNDTRPYAERLCETVEQHFGAAQKLLSEIRKLQG